MLTRTTEKLEEILGCLEKVQEESVVTPDNPADWLRGRLSGKEVVLFCGAGISVAAPSSAPAFLSLRDNAILAALDILLSRGLITEDAIHLVEHAVDRLEDRCDLSLPPEHVFGMFSHALGFEVVHKLLEVCLSNRSPNFNHLAIRDLSQSRNDWSLMGVITPNFDTYLEEAFGGISSVARYVLDDDAGKTGGFIIQKPHGTLDKPESIAITIEKVARPLKGKSRQALQAMVSGREIIVIGYSGWDYDLLPLIAAAAKDWGATVYWLLYDEYSWNERVGAVKLAKPENCEVVNCQRANILPMLANRPIEESSSVRPSLRDDIRKSLENEADHSLIGAILSLLVPMGVPESDGLVSDLCLELITMGKEGILPAERKSVAILGQVPGWLSTDNERKREAAEIVVQLAKQIGWTAAAESHQRTLAKNSDSRQPKDRIREIDLELSEPVVLIDSEPDPENAKRSLRTSLLIEKAQLLEERGLKEEAEKLAYEILANTKFPESGISPDCWIVDDGHQAAPLLQLLGMCEFERGEFDSADKHLAGAIDLLWRERSLWEIGTALTQVAHLVRKADRRAAQLAMDAAIAVARFERDKLSELVAIEWMLEFGLGGAGSVKAAFEILYELSIEKSELEEHQKILQRFKLKYLT